MKVGKGACPFNLLYWNFIAENAGALRGNPRMAMPYRTWEGMESGRKEQILTEARAFLDRLNARPEASRGHQAMLDL